MSAGKEPSLPHGSAIAFCASFHRGGGAGGEDEVAGLHDIRGEG